MAYRKSKSPSIRKTLTGLAVVSLVLFLLPTRWTGGLIGLVQLIVPLQDASTAVVETAQQVVGSAPSGLSAEQWNQAQRHAAGLAHQTAALSARVDELEHEVEALTATRLWDAGGAKIGSRGRLIPARVLSEDILPWRSSRLITTGSLQGVPDRAPVISDSFAVGRGDEAGLRDGMAILLGESYIGSVDKVGPHVSRVKLLSDPSVHMKVRVGRFVEGGFALADGYFWMVGRGGSAMEIREVEARMVQSGALEVGDVVLSDPTNEMLPAALTIGSVASVIMDRDNPLFVHLAVVPVLSRAALDQVYVFDPQLTQSP